MENKQTAVEWLAIQLYEKMNMSGSGKVFDEILEQAEQIQKEQRITDYHAGYSDALCNHVRDAENYVNETSSKA